MPEEEDIEATVLNRFDLPEVAVTGPRRNRACFVIVAGANVGEMFPLEDSGDLIIGRSSEAQLQLTDEGVSRRHVRVHCRMDEIVIEDLGSANGTRVNGDKIVQHTLVDGDKLQLGSTSVLKFTYQDELDEAFQRNMLDAAQRDGLTGAFNKGYFAHRLETEMAYAARHKVPLSLLLLDLDHFKNVNDTYGHPAGDAVLVQLTRLVHAQLRTEDVFARYGGEEFALLCRATATEEAMLVGERVRVGVETTSFMSDGVRLPVTVSIGLATFVGGQGGADALVERADRALYAAKGGGRNRVVCEGEAIVSEEG